VELLIMPFSVILARRIGYLQLMVVGAAFGVAANICFAFTASAAGMFAGQILMGGVWGIFAALGIIVAQRLLPSAVATASAIFMSSTAISSALGGLTGGVGVAVLGLPLVFVLPALYGVLAVVGPGVMARTTHLERRGATAIRVVGLYATLSVEAHDPGHPAHDYFSARYAWLRRDVRQALEELAERGLTRSGLELSDLESDIIALIDGLQIQWLLDSERVDMAAHLRRRLNQLLTVSIV
jgi:MFS family permease